MEITEPHGSHFQLALEKFRAGHHISFRRAGLSLSQDGYLQVSYRSSWWPENVAEETALHDFRDAENVVNNLISESPSLAAIIKDYPYRLMLYDNYGEMEMCRLVGGALIWARGMSKSTGAI